MKLIIAIVQDQDAPGLVDDLMEREYRVTKSGFYGSF